MSNWVTFYYDLLNDRVYDLKKHTDKEAALKWFNSHCKRYFQLNSQFKAEKLPATYGYLFRKYCAISSRAFKKEFGITIDEALKIANKKEG